MFEDGVAAYQRTDYSTALNFLRPVAEQGDVNAQHDLGLMYYNGEGGPQDLTEAEKWWRKAAEQGHAYAQFSLGSVYQYGHGVPQDKALAHMWFSLAAVQIFEGAMGRDMVAEEMTPDQITKAQRMAREWMAKHQ